jgi:cell wall-associated NlpC family hydrolase
MGVMRFRLESNRIASRRLQSIVRGTMKRILLALACVLFSCSSDDALPNVPGDTGDDSNDPVVPPPEEIDPGKVVPSAADTLRTTSDVNLREKPSIDAVILRVIPSGTTVKVLDKTPQNGFFNVEALAVRGWISSKYLESTTVTPPVPVGTPSVDNAIARAKSAVGFSYYWGGGAWLPEGPTASTKGSCSGNCPSCTHTGKYGADCSGLIAKAWQYGDVSLEANSHPFGTTHFVTPKAGYWANSNRAAMQKADALVYNTGGAGHIVLYERGDAWGSPVVYECKGCAAGCVYNARTFGTQYKAIRRTGF